MCECNSLADCETVRMVGTCCRLWSDVNWTWSVCYSQACQGPHLTVQLHQQAPAVLMLQSQFHQSSVAEGGSPWAIDHSLTCGHSDGRFLCLTSAAALLCRRSWLSCRQVGACQKGSKQAAVTSAATHMCRWRCTATACAGRTPQPASCCTGTSGAYGIVRGLHSLRFCQARWVTMASTHAACQLDCCCYCDHASCQVDCCCCYDQASCQCG